MPSPLVTVIVPGRDVAPYVDAALASLRAQSLADWCAILIDDGSTDDTGHLFARAAADDERIRVVNHTESLGLGAARNVGLDLVDTPFVGFLDADDELTPTALERLVSTVRDTGSDFAVGGYVRLHPEGSGYRTGAVQPWVAAATDPARVATTLGEHPEASGNIVAWSKVSRIEFLRRAAIRFPEGVLFEDHVVAQQMYARARAFDVIPDVVMRWRVRAEGTSITQHTDRLPVLSAYLDALTAGIDVLDSAGFGPAVRARIDLVMRMDLPPLVHLAEQHPDPHYRARLGRFARELLDRADRSGVAAASENAALIGAAALW